ncbi:DNA starvation/stationary phase protection protein [Thioclava sp. SK-1]|uniref:Dps family protein n=1 Tax=Thioclava sp. SK-1 TaxID=1889770 RepID=UPI00082451BB|nr:DNA starvation/stationary phase protection protein [Thioclava sp. SK-1]OCX64641.1 DNA starvation/stationary phase protection protein [Thioclava sp. SK-1]
MSQTAVSLSPTAREAIAEALQQSVAETVVATMLAQNFHWNVKGMAFGPLHELFQTIYEDHFVAQDDLAERIRAIDVMAEGTLKSMLERSKVEEHEGPATDREMIAMLVKAQEIVAATLHGAGDIAADNGDTLTEDLCIERGRIHEKFAWILRSHLG